MSQTEFHKGKLIPITFEGELENFAEKICKEKGEKELRSYYKTWVDQLQGDFGDYFIYQNKLYKITEHYKETDEEESYIKLIPHLDGSIEFISQFYNGNCGFLDMLEEGFDLHAEQ